MTFPRSRQGTRQVVFVTFSNDYVTPLSPPHEIVLSEVSRESGLLATEITGPAKSLRLVRARRLTAKRLKRDYGYSVCQISLALHKHRLTVDGYFHQDRAARRVELPKLSTLE